MKSGIHPTYFSDAKVVCSCGNTFTTGSTKQEIRVEVCYNCHPVYTGVKRYLDTLGRVDKFVLAQQNAQKVQSNKKQKNDQSSVKQAGPKTIREMLEQQIDEDSAAK